MGGGETRRYCLAPLRACLAPSCAPPAAAHRTPPMAILIASTPAPRRRCATQPMAARSRSTRRFGCVIESGASPRENPIMSTSARAVFARARPTSHARRPDPRHVYTRAQPRIHHEANRSVFHRDLDSRRAALPGTAFGADDRDERRRRVRGLRSAAPVRRSRHAAGNVSTPRRRRFAAAARTLEEPIKKSECRTRAPHSFVQHPKSFHLISTRLSSSVRHSDSERVCHFFSVNSDS